MKTISALNLSGFVQDSMEQTLLDLIFFFNFILISLRSPYKRDPRSLFLYVTENSDDFHLFFSTANHRERYGVLHYVCTAILVTSSDPIQACWSTPRPPPPLHGFALLC